MFLGWEWQNCFQKALRALWTGLISSCFKTIHIPLSFEKSRRVWSTKLGHPANRSSSVDSFSCKVLQGDSMSQYPPFWNAPADLKKNIYLCTCPVLFCIIHLRWPCTLLQVVIYLFALRRGAGCRVSEHCCETKDVYPSWFTNQARNSWMIPEITASYC